MKRLVKLAVFVPVRPLRSTTRPGRQSRSRIATVDHSDIRGSKPHNRDPSGATSHYTRGLGPEADRLESSRALLSVGSPDCRPGRVVPSPGVTPPADPGPRPLGRWPR